MNVDRMKSLFESSLREFLGLQRELIISGVSERCMCGALMLCVRRELDKTDLSNYHVDVEYNRNYGGRLKTIRTTEDAQIVSITCDLIVHSRGEISQFDNLIAIEMKRSRHPRAEKKKDKIRLMSLTAPLDRGIVYSNDGVTFPEVVCGYLLGVYFEIDSKHETAVIEYYFDGELESSRSISFGTAQCYSD